VLLSDQGLAGDQRTARFVAAFASNQGAFFDQFAKSMVKLGSIKAAAAGEIRRNCFRPNGRVSLDDVSALIGDDAAAVASDEGFAASA
jgi:peroxidase